MTISRDWSKTADLDRVALVQRRLAELDAAFPARLESAEALCVCCEGPAFEEPEQRVRSIVRAWKGRRLELPVQALLRESLGHGSAMVHCSLRRLACFLPALIAAWLRHPPEVSLGEVVLLIQEAEAGEATYRRQSPACWSAGERDALTAIFLAVLRAQLSSPESDPCATLSGACALRVPADPLIEGWLEDETRTAEDHLLAAVARLEGRRPTREPRATGLSPSADELTLQGAWMLAREATRAALERHFFEEQETHPDRARAWSQAEAAVQQLMGYE
jgi:hypothetical protein